MIGLINRGNLPDTTQSEFENFSSRLREIFLKEHNEDGTHISSVGVLNTVPVGAVMMWPTDTAPSGWVLLQGQQLSRSTYASIFTMFGTTYGVGDGSTTFNVPDMRQRFPLGKAAAGTGSTLGATGGIIDNAITGSTATESTHTHSVDPPNTAANFTGLEVDRNLDGVTGSVVRTSDGVEVNIASFTSGAGSAHSHGVGTLALTSGNPPFLTLNYIMFSGVA